MKFILIYIFFSLSILSFGQYSKIDSLTLRKFNEKWIEDLLKLDDNEVKLKMIVEKLKVDSIVSRSDIKEKIDVTERDYTSYDTVELSEAFKRTKKCKILF